MDEIRYGSHQGRRDPVVGELHKNEHQVTLCADVIEFATPCHMCALCTCDEYILGYYSHDPARHSDRVLQPPEKKERNPRESASRQAGTQRRQTLLPIIKLGRKKKTHSTCTTWPKIASEQ